MSHDESPPPAETTDRSGWIQFFDTFLQEKNIKWMLGLGGLILFASSLMLITSHWQDYTPLWKSGVIMGYTAVLFVLGEIAYLQLGLQRTGIGLMAMTVLLIPVSFLAVRAVHPDRVDAGEITGIAAMLVLNLSFAAIAGRRILRRFLHEDQLTFLASYLLLGLAGAIVPGLPASFAIPTAVTLWAVFCLGTVKVNRHVFWLGEENKLPRIFGFFPILLLGLQFVMTFAFLAPNIQLGWMGLGLVLAAIPVLMTADTLANVFRERTGDWIRPLPWSLVIPLLVGLWLSLAGVTLAVVGAPVEAKVPAAFLAAVVFAQIAKRTRHSGFVWMMWAAILTGYQSLPVFFREVARQVVHQGADAVSEARLPFAFYGLTYLPLLVFGMGLIAWFRRRELAWLAKPTQQFITALTLFLWTLSITHSKAMFPVGMVSMVMMAWQMVAFRVPVLRFGVAAAWIGTCWGLIPFLTGVLHWTLPSEAVWWALCGSAACLLIPDRFLSRESKPHPYAIGDAMSALMTFALSAAWVCRWYSQNFTDIPGGGDAWTSGAVIVGLLMIHAVLQVSSWLSVWTLSLATFYGVAVAVSFDVSAPTILSTGIFAMGGGWVLSGLLRRFPEWRVSRAFAGPLGLFSGWILATALFLLSWPHFLVVASGFSNEPLWISLLIPVAWAFDAAVRWQKSVWTYFGFAVSLPLVSAVSALLLGHDVAFHWLPTMFAGCGVLVAAVLPRPFQWKSATTPEGYSEDRFRNRVLPLGRCVLGLFVLLAVSTLPVFSLPARIAALLSLFGLFGLTGRWNNTGMRYLGLGLLNWHVLTGVVQVAVPDARVLWDLHGSDWANLALPMAFAAALSRGLWSLSSQKPGETIGECVSFHRFVLLVLTLAGFWGSLQHLVVGLSPVGIALAAGTFLILTAEQIGLAIRRQEETPVWWAEATMVCGLGYFLLFEVITVGTGWSLYGVLIAGFVAWGIGAAVRTSARLNILSGPLMQTGYVLPMVTVLLGMLHHFAGRQSLWLGSNSLALLLAGGFYFWRGVAERRKTWLVTSAVVLNVALTLLWRELAWWDPQLFAIPLGISILMLVQWLKEEIPAKAHDPLRYLGALVILVSPVFHIVGGSWLHLLTLMIASVAVTLTAMGLRIRALMYTGTAFLVGDLIAMVVRGSVDNPTLLWIAGIGFGLCVISLAAYCEKHREQVLGRLRHMAVRLESWE